MALKHHVSLRDRVITTTAIHVMALDGIVNVNSLFTLALFLGLTTTDPPTALIGGSTSTCPASGTAVVERLVSCHVYSFSSFLFSSLVALALKQAIKISIDERGGEETMGVARGVNVSLLRVNLMCLRVGILVSAFGSVFGCGFLTVALVDLVQIKLGALRCGGFDTVAAVTPLVLLVPLALFVYVFLLLYAFVH